MLITVLLLGFSFDTLEYKAQRIIRHFAKICAQS